MINDFGWLFISDAQDVAVKETSELVGQDEGVARGSANVHCILGRESANLIVLEGAASGSADVYCVLERESANLIVLEGAARSSADVHFVLGRVG